MSHRHNNGDVQNNIPLKSHISSHAVNADVEIMMEWGKRSLPDSELVWFTSQRTRFKSL